MQWGGASTQINIQSKQLGYVKFRFDKMYANVENMIHELYRPHHISVRIRSQSLTVVPYKLYASLASSSGVELQPPPGLSVMYYSKADSRSRAGRNYIEPCKDRSQHGYIGRSWTT